MALRRITKRRPYARLVGICCEGRRTEVQYFSLPFFKGWNRQIEVFPAPDGSSPDKLIQAMNKWMNTHGLKAGDELWLVADVDQWTEEQLLSLVQWANSQNGEIHRGAAISNPKFEYWLLLHFEESPPKTARACVERLREHLPGYDKLIPAAAFTKDMALAATQRASRADQPPCETFPRECGKTTVYRLASHLLTPQTSPNG